MEEIVRRLVIKVWENPAFKKRLLADPVKTIEQFTGRSLPKGIKIQVHEQTKSTLHLVIPRKPIEQLTPELICAMLLTAGGSMTLPGIDCPYDRPDIGIGRARKGTK
jgi:hypothetical protein